MDREPRRKRLERFARNERIFPGGDHPTGNCGACARIITDRFGGKVVGYYHADNPTARVGEVEFGHDFAITEDASWSIRGFTTTMAIPQCST